MKKTTKRILAFTLAFMMAFGIGGVPAMATAAPTPAYAEIAAASVSDTMSDRAVTFVIMLIPIVGPFIAFFMSDNSMSILLAFIISLFVPIVGPLLYLVGVI